MKKLWFFVTYLLLKIHRYGQVSYGPVIGLHEDTISFVDNPDNFGVETGHVLMPKVGWFYQLSLSDRWTITPQLMLAGKGGKVNYGDVSTAKKGYTM